jgi:hypothetical protein
MHWSHQQRYSPSLIIFLPLVASVFPNTTVRLFEDAGWNPAGVKAVAAPASTTKRSEEENIIEEENRKRPQMQKLSTRIIKNHKWQKGLGMMKSNAKVEISKLPRKAMTSPRQEPKGRYVPQSGFETLCKNEHTRPLGRRSSIFRASCLFGVVNAEETWIHEGCEWWAFPDRPHAAQVALLPSRTQTGLADQSRICIPEICWSHFWLSWTSFRCCDTCRLNILGHVKSRSWKHLDEGET